jgi:hypothetical protein
MQMAYSYNNMLHFMRQQNKDKVIEFIYDNEVEVALPKLGRQALEAIDSDDKLKIVCVYVAQTLAETYMEYVLFGENDFEITFSGGNGVLLKCDALHRDGRLGRIECSGDFQGFNDATTS